jgi:hypothetical protein
MNARLEESQQDKEIATKEAEIASHNKSEPT